MTTTWDAAAPFRPGTDRTAAAEAHRLLAAGLVRPVLADVLVAASDPDTAQLRAAAAALVLQDRVLDAWAVAFRSALWVHAGPPEGGRAPAELEVAVPPGRHRPAGPGIRQRQVTMQPADVMTIGGLRVTSPVRTAADLARDLPPPQARPALDRLRAATGVEPAAVRRRLRGMPSARNVAEARRLLRGWDGVGWGG